MKIFLFSFNGNKTAGSAQKFRVGRVIGNKVICFPFGFMKIYVLMIVQLQIIAYFHINNVWLHQESMSVKCTPP